VNTVGRRAAIVTGSDSGIGRAAALALARDGFDIGVSWHTDEAGATRTADLVRQRGQAASVARLDLECERDIPAVIASLVTALKGLHVLVNNAAVDHRSDILAETLDDWSRVLRVNLTGQFLCGQAAAKAMVSQGEGGRIVNVTSIHEHVPARRAAAYCAAKAGLGILTKVMALDLAPYGITVNAVAPGHIATEMTGWRGVPAVLPSRHAIPAGRIGAAEDVASAIAYLCSEACHYTTGTSILVDGGLLLTSVAAIEDENLRETHIQQTPPKQGDRR